VPASVADLNQLFPDGAQRTELPAHLSGLAGIVC